MTRYRQGWKALNRLLHEDRSFSGNEKNCAFLNMQDGRYASISSVAGLDFSDDSRALAICDWDFDGKLDLWESARTAPRVRLVRNQTPTKGRFVAIQLQGNGSTTNRDAIGARVEVVTDKNDGRSIKTLHAGEGFLTQSSRWMHFGLSDATTIKQIRVNWPAGTQTIYGPVELDRFYLIAQSTNEITEWQPPSSRHALQPTSLEVVKSESSIRIIPPYRLPLPNLTVITKASQQQELELQGPTLVSVWSDQCTTCLAELHQWSKNQALFLKHGLNVVALNADLLLDNVDFQRREKILAELKFPFASHAADADSIRSLDYFQRALMDRWQVMPVPCSFLTDEFGRVVAIYKGPIELEQIWSDLDLLRAAPEKLRVASLPFPGRWGSSVPNADPSRVSSQMVDHTAFNAAIDYLEQFVRTARKSGQQVNVVQLADVQYVRSVLLESQGRIEEAQASLEACKALNPNDYRVRTDLANLFIKARNFTAAEEELQAAVNINPSDLRLQRDLAMSQLQQQKYEPAIKQFASILKQNPNDATSYFHLATALRNVGRWSEAKKAYVRALKGKSTFILSANNLAWILATHPDAKHRSGKQAISLAKRICEQTKFAQPEFLDTLGAAYAEDGQFDKAIETLDQAISLVSKKPGSDDGSLAKRKQLYQEKKPFREESWAGE